MAGGRPPYFESQKKLNEKIEAYFVFIQGERRLTKTGRQSRQWLRAPENATVTGLALYLGFESRQSFYDYEKHEQYSYTIKNARLRIEAAYEQQLLSKNATGAIFALKNFGWKDKQEHEHSGDMGIHWNEQKTYEAKPENKD